MKNNKQSAKKVCTVDSSLARIKETLLQLAYANSDKWNGYHKLHNHELRADVAHLPAQGSVYNATACASRGRGQKVAIATNIQRSSEILTQHQRRSEMDPSSFVSHRAPRKDFCKLPHIAERFPENDEAERSCIPRPNNMNTSGDSSPEGRATELVVTAVIEPPPRSRAPGNSKPAARLKVGKNLANTQKHNIDLETIEVMKSPENESYRNNNPFREIMLPRSLLTLSNDIMQEHQYSNPAHNKENYNTESIIGELKGGKTVKKRKLQKKKLKRASPKLEVPYEDITMRDAAFQDDDSLYGDEALISRMGQCKRKKASVSNHPEAQSVHDEPMCASLQQHLMSDTDEFPELEMEVVPLHEPFVFESLTSSSSNSASSMKVGKPDEPILLDTSANNNEYSVIHLELADDVNNLRSSTEKHNNKQLFPSSSPVAEENFNSVATYPHNLSNHHPIRSWSDTGLTASRSFKNILQTFLSSYGALVQRSLQLFQTPVNGDSDNIIKLLVQLQNEIQNDKN